jgi:hypothetical protein
MSIIFEDFSFFLFLFPGCGEKGSVETHVEDEFLLWEGNRMPVHPDPDVPSCESSGYSLEPGWSAEEFAGVDLQDQRLNKRLLLVSAQFAAQPQAQINQACEDWASAKGAYRLFENEKVNGERILAPHQQRTYARMACHSLILAVQDTTYFNYSHHPATQGLGLIGSVEDGQVGLIMPTTLALTPQGVPLGVLTQETWARHQAGVRSNECVRDVHDGATYSGAGTQLAHRSRGRGPRERPG